MHKARHESSRARLSQYEAAEPRTQPTQPKNINLTDWNSQGQGPFHTRVFRVWTIVYFWPKMTLITVQQFQRYLQWQQYQVSHVTG